MRRSIRRCLAAVALGAFAAAGTAVLAQPAPSPAGAPPRSGMTAGSEKTPAERAARLRDVLQLRPDQEPALQAFVGAVESAGQAMRGAMTSMAGPAPATTPERLDRMQRIMAQHQATLATVTDATRRFYAQLTPAQQHAFDALPLPMLTPGDMPMRRGGPGAAGGRPMMGPPPGAP